MGLPVGGVSLTSIVLPSGIFDACSVTVTGLVCVLGRVMSGDVCNEPAGEAGALVPPTDAIRNVGVLVSVIGPGSPASINFGLLSKVKLLILNDSMRA